MHEKELLFGDDARIKILSGASKIAKAVVSTLGPLGRNVVIRRGPMRPPLLTKDGVTVAKEIKAFKDPYEDIGLQMVKEAASRTNDTAGDGTTTATLLAHEMMKAGLDHVKKGVNAIHLRRGMQAAVAAICKKLDEMKVEVDSPEQYKAIATISSQDEEIGALVSLVVQEVGKDGAISVEPGQSLGIEYTKSEGMQIASGYVNPLFVNKKDKPVCVIDEPYVLVTDERILNIDQIIPIIEQVHEQNGSLVIIAESVEHEALATLVMNLPWVNAGQKEKSDFASLAIRAPEIGDRRKEVLEDIAASVGARVITKGVGLSLQSCVLEDLGRAKKVTSTKGISVIMGGDGVVEERAARIRELIEETEDAEEKDFLKGRLANLTGSIGVLRVGAASEVEQKEKQHRVEDAIAAVRAATEEGIIPGGGTAFMECVSLISLMEFATADEKTGASIVQETLKKPLWWIAANAGYDGDDVVKKVTKLEPGHGFNAETGKYGDMMKDNVIDPKKVARCALENAVSIAGGFLTLEVGIVDDETVVASPLQNAGGR